MAEVLLVRASTGSEEGTVVGYYGERRRREGEEFELEDPSHFSYRWMEALDWVPPPPTGPVLPPPGADMATYVAERYSFKEDSDASSEGEGGLQVGEPREAVSRKRRKGESRASG